MGNEEIVQNPEEILNALKESEERFRTLFEHMTEGVALHELIYDENGKAINYIITNVNPAYERHTGVKAAHVCGIPATQAYGTEIAPYFEEFSRVALSGKPYSFETYFPPMKKHFNIGVICPKKGTFATVFEDITERKKNEIELKIKNEEMERFTYAVSHDLKSPLITIQTFLGYLLEDFKNNNSKRLETDISFIQNAVYKMGRLLDEILELSRIGRVTSPHEEIELGYIIGEVKKLIAGRIVQNNVEINMSDKKCMIFGDRKRFIQVFQNILDNSIKFMINSSSPKIIIDETIEEGMNKITIKDNGMGFEPKYKDKLFGLFEKLNPEMEGTGVGLVTVKKIIENHGGKVSIDSEGIGKGATVTIFLPIVK